MRNLSFDRVASHPAANKHVRHLIPGRCDHRAGAGKLTAKRRDISRRDLTPDF
jgi:hypothetical protein